MRKKRIITEKKWTNKFLLILSFLIKNFYWIIVILIILFICSIFLIELTPIPLIIIGILLPLYLFVSIIGMLIQVLDSLLEPNTNLLKIFLSYTAAIILFIAFFSAIYVVLNSLNIGYLSYGDCNEFFQIESSNEALHSKVINQWNTIYFTSVTFFTVGYGDICPMGWNRFVSVFNAYAGHAFTTIILVIALSSYAKRKKQ